VTQLAEEGAIKPGQVVLVRADLNVPFSKKEPGVITDDTRLRGALPTVQFLREKGAKVVVATHCGRPKGKPNPDFSVAPIAEAFSALLGSEVKTASDCIGPAVQATVNEMKNSEVLLLENVRFHAGETDNCPDFAKALVAASGADIFVQDAFGTAHRAHASTAGVASFMKHNVAGLLVAKELDYIEGAVLKSPQRPLVGILGGAKVSSKIPILKSLLAKCDTVVVSGGMTGTFYKAKGYNTGTSLVEEDLIPMAAEFLEYAEKNEVNIQLAHDGVMGEGSTFEDIKEDMNIKVMDVDSVEEGNWMKLDMGPESLEKVKEILSEAKTIIWNGPCGVFEIDAFATGTNTIARTMADVTKKGTITIVGGGDSAYAITKLGLHTEVSHVSTGGGAALELLQGETLPGIAVLDSA